MTIRDYFTRRPHVDGLERTIGMLTEIREASLDVSDQVMAEHPGGTVHDLTVGLPADALDGLILQLDAAKRFRDLLLDITHRQRLLVAASLVTSLLSAVLALWNLLR